MPSFCKTHDSTYFETILASDDTTTDVEAK
jgi:hypothetical protein